jgi:hypothetical protein
LGVNQKLVAKDALPSIEFVFFDSGMLDMTSEKISDSHRFMSRRAMMLSSTIAVATPALSRGTFAKAIDDTTAELNARRSASKEIRELATAESSVRPFPHHPTNGDEEKLRPLYVGNYCKGLPQDQNGFVDPKAYEALTAALASGDPADFENIPLAKLPPGPAPAILQSVATLRVEDVRGVPHVASVEQFYRTGAEFNEMETNRDKHPPRFYRVHSEASASPEGNGQLVDPQAALAFDLEGADSHAFRIDPPPSYQSDESVAEIAENYWMALLRDLPFMEFENTSNKLVAAAIDHLNTFAPSLLKVPRDPTTNKITGKTLFRGTTSGDLAGPYISQFLLRDIPFGGYTVKQQVKVGYPKVNNLDQVFLNNAADWYTSQLGFFLPAVEYDSKADRYNYRPRELCNYVHVDELFQGYLNAELLLNVAPERGGLGAPFGRGNPYTSSKTQGGFGTLGQPNFSSVVAEVATRALKAVWYQKWAVHRRLRPEAFAGHIHFFKTSNGNIQYPLAPNVLAMLGPVLDQVQQFNKTRKGDGYFLPMAFQDGCPLHPAYGAGHATVAGACVTLLKAFYQDVPFSALPNPSQQEIWVPKPDGSLPFSLMKGKPTPDGCPYTYDELSAALTLHGELNKLASNVSLARNFAGVHWRSDHAASLPLGENVAIKFLEQIVNTYNENVSFSFLRFDGTPVSISKV